jgi:3-oxoadipate enol-lactonase
MPWTDASGVSIRYEMSGAGARSLILIHELGGSLESWDRLLPWVEREHRVLRVDQRGAGLSEKVREPFTIDDHARDLDAAVQAGGLDPPYAVAGVAGGAAVAFLFAYRHLADISAAVLCAPSIGIAPDRRQYFHERSALAARLGMRAIIDATLMKAYPEDVIRDREMYEAYRARFLGNDPIGYGLCSRALAESNLESLAGALTCRCLILAGSRDPLRPPARARELANRLPHAEFDVIDSGHFMHVQSPREVAARILAFLHGADA